MINQLLSDKSANELVCNFFGFNIKHFHSDKHKSEISASST